MPSLLICDFQLIRRSEEHKNTTVSALIWDSDEGRVFAGDMLGVVSVIHVPQSNKVKKFLHLSWLNVIKKNLLESPYVSEVVIWVSEM